MTAKMQSQWFLAQKLFKVLPRCQCFGQSDLFSGHFRSLFYLVIFLFKIQYLQYIGVLTVGDYLEEGEAKMILTLWGWPHRKYRMRT